MKSNYSCNKGKTLNNGKGDSAVACAVVSPKKPTAAVLLVNKMICLGRYIVIKPFPSCLFSYAHSNP